MNIERELRDWLVKRIKTLETDILELKQRIRDVELMKKDGEWVGHGVYSQYTQNKSQLILLTAALTQAETLLAEFQGRGK